MRSTGSKAWRYRYRYADKASIVTIGECRRCRSSRLGWSERLTLSRRPEQIGELLRAPHSYQGSLVTQAALRLAPLLFVRPGELCVAKWADIETPAAIRRFIQTLSPSK